MAKTQIRSHNLLDQDVKKDDLCTTIPGQSVITSIAAGNGITIESTGADSGTGLVTISSTNSNKVTVSDSLPALETRSEGDIHIMSTDGRIYVKESGTWIEKMDTATQQEADAVSLKEAQFSIAMAILLG